MIRYFLAEGDRADAAIITEGLSSFTCNFPPPAVRIATVGMKTWCVACHRQGVIAARGPRWPGTGPNGQPWALSGDVNVCGCEPPPVFVAERMVKMEFTAEEVVALARERGEGADAARDAGSGARARAVNEAAATDRCDEQVRTVWMCPRFADYPYVIETFYGARYSGRLDADGLLPRIVTADEDQYAIYWGDDALAHEDWI